MIDLNILAPRSIRYFGDLHPFRKWHKSLKEQGINVAFYDSHTDKNLPNSEYLLLHHRYFDTGIFSGWENSPEKGEEIRKFLTTIKTGVKKLIWFDANDSSGTTQFPIISHVDVFVKKQRLKDLNYYAGNASDLKNVKVWLHPEVPQKKFVPCPADQLYKIKLGWNIAYLDYRNFLLHYRVRKYLSYYIGYKLFPIHYTPVDADREYDVTFRGTVNYNSRQDPVNAQRSKVLKLLTTLPHKIATGGVVTRSQYLNELRTSKITISPFGYGEVCYRDFETFISGSVLVKPSMEHLQTFPNLFIPGETYVPVDWNLNNLEETIDRILSNYNFYKEIAANGQEHYQKYMNDAELFIRQVRSLLI